MWFRATRLLEHGWGRCTCSSTNFLGERTGWRGRARPSKGPCWVRVPSLVESCSSILKSWLSPSHVKLDRSVRLNLDIFAQAAAEGKVNSYSKMQNHQLHLNRLFSPQTVKTWISCQVSLDPMNLPWSNTIMSCNQHSFPHAAKPGNGQQAFVNLSSWSRPLVIRPPKCVSLRHLVVIECCRYHARA